MFLQKKETPKKRKLNKTTKNEENPQILDDTIIYVMVAAVVISN